jgi:aromatase
MTAQRETDSAFTRDDLTDILCAAAGIPAAMLNKAGDSTLEDLGLESLAVMQLQAGVRTRCQVLLPDDALGMSLPEIMNYIDVRLGLGA